MITILIDLEDLIFNTDDRLVIEVASNEKTIAKVDEHNYLMLAEANVPFEEVTC